MTNIRRINYTPKKEITKEIVDETNQGLWVAFAKNSSNKVIIQRQSAFNPSQIFFNLERSVEGVTNFDVDTSFLYCAYNDTSLIGEKISLTNPLTITTNISKPIGIDENPVDVKVNGSDLWFLLPGESTGVFATLLLYNLSGTLQQTIELMDTNNSVQYARSLTIDTNNDLWINTYTSPMQTVRVYDIGGGVYDFQVTEIS